MTGTGRNDEVIDEQLVEAIRDVYRDVHLPVALAEIQQHARHWRTRIAVAPRLRMALVAAAAVTVVIIGTWGGFTRSEDGGRSEPGQPLPSASAGRAGKPARPTSSASTDAGKCADYLQAELDPSRASDNPPLRLSLDLDQTRLLIYAIDNFAVTCWLAGDQVTIGGSATAVNTGRYPPGQLSYHSEDSGRGWGGVAFGRVPAGTTQVTISFPTGPDANATVVGEWYGYLARPGSESDKLAEATRVTALTRTGNLTQQIRHG